MGAVVWAMEMSVIWTVTAAFHFNQSACQPPDLMLDICKLYTRLYIETKAVCVLVNAMGIFMEDLISPGVKVQLGGVRIL